MTREEVYSIIDKYYRANYKKCVKKVLNRSGSWHNAEDVVQEAFTRALQYWVSLEHKDSFQAWFEKILGNALKTQAADNRMRGMTAGMPDERDTQLPTQFNSALIEELKRDVRELPQPRRKILELVLFHGYDPLDITRIEDISQSAVWAMVSRYRAEIRAKYGSRLYS